MLGCLAILSTILSTMVVIVPIACMNLDKQLEEDENIDAMQLENGNQCSISSDDNQQPKRITTEELEDTKQKKPNTKRELKSAKSSVKNRKSVSRFSGESMVGNSTRVTHTTSRKNTKNTEHSNPYSAYGDEHEAPQPREMSNCPHRMKLPKRDRNDPAYATMKSVVSDWSSSHTQNTYTKKKKKTYIGLMLGQRNTKNEDPTQSYINAPEN